MFKLPPRKIFSYVLVFGAIFASSIPSLLMPIEANSLPRNKDNSLNEQNKQSKASSSVGKFRLFYKPSAEHAILQLLFDKSGLFAKTVNDLNNQNLNLPIDIPITFEDCGVPNAFYSPSDRAVTMCYELFDNIAEGLADSYPTQEEVLLNAAYTQVFVLYHEVGHALTDILELAVTGREEDAVDDFAAILLLRDNNASADDIVLNASLYFSSRPDGPYWGEHSFGQQRFYNRPVVK